MNHILFFVVTLWVSGIASSLLADAPSQDGKQVYGAKLHQPPTSESTFNWLTGENINLGGVLFPHLHFQAVYGITTAGDLEHFAAGHHDPSSDGWTIQGFEFGTSLHATQHLEGFVTYHVYQEADHRNWEGDFEEWFLKLKDLPGGIELRAGRYLNRFGLHNATHMHGWSFIDNQLVNGRFLGDDSLSTIGGEITWNLPTPWTSMLTFSFGEAQEHDAHGHSHDEHSVFDPENAHFNDTVYVSNWTNQYDYNDFHQYQFGVSASWGKNRMDETTQIYGLHLQYQWRENGFETGGRYFRWRTEAMFRQFEFDDHSLNHHEHKHEHAEEHEHEHGPAHDHAGDDHKHPSSAEELGLYTSLVYGWDNGFELGLRGDFVSGISEAGLSERYRISPNLTYFLNHSRTLYLRGQYNYDYSPDFHDEHGIWLQIGFNWGTGREVR